MPPARATCRTQSGSVRSTTSAASTRGDPVDRGDTQRAGDHNKVGKTVDRRRRSAEGYESLDITDAKLKELGAFGMSPPFKMSCAKHEGPSAGQGDAMGWQEVPDRDRTGCRRPKAFIRKMVEELGGEVCRREEHHAARLRLIEGAAGALARCLRDGAAPTLGADVGSRDCQTAMTMLLLHRLLNGPQRPKPRRTLLAVNNIEVIYDHVILVLQRRVARGAARQDRRAARRQRRRQEHDAQIDLDAAGVRAGRR